MGELAGRLVGTTTWFSVVAVMLTLPTVAAAHSPMSSGSASEAPVAADPDLKLYRGWVATEYTYPDDWFGGNPGKHYSREWHADVSTTSLSATSWGEVYYYFVNSPPSQCQKSEHAGVGGGQADFAVFPSEANSLYGLHDLPEGTSMTAFQPHSDLRVGMPGVSYLCDDHGPYYDSLEETVTNTPATVPWPNNGTYPTTAGRDYRWTTDPYGHLVHSVVCMTTSSIDTDSDGLPDSVDLDPLAAGEPEDLGSPDGVDGQYEEPRLEGGPGHHEGIPTCPTLDERCIDAPPGTSTDSDGDRLPDVYEIEVSGTDPDSADTDGDCVPDAIEVASGSAPWDPSEVPDTLPAGGPPRRVAGRGDAGITCGITEFRWVTPALRSLRIPAGRRGCILLLSNKTANAIIDFALAHEKETLTSALVKFTGDHLGEVYGEETVDWQEEYQVDKTLSRAKRQAKKALFRALNLTRLNGFYRASEIAALSGVALGAVWALNQIRNRDACIQVRVGHGKDGKPRLSWSLVYSKDQLTAAGIKDGLHKAGVWKKKARTLKVDIAVRKHINLACNRGDVVASGGDADRVFTRAISFVF
ncbi:hypothetical protein [Nocardioides immobilis]|nr:hypothetical protein [Nocardioides immobilis]